MVKKQARCETEAFYCFSSLRLMQAEYLQSDISPLTSEVISSTPSTDEDKGNKLQYSRVILSHPLASCSFLLGIRLHEFEASQSMGYS